MNNLDEWKKDGFKGETMLVLPTESFQNYMEHPLVRRLYLTDVGYFPRAKHHYRERKDGIEEYIYIYCTEGTGIIEMEGKKYTLCENEAICIPQYVGHCYYALDENPWSILWVHFKGEDVQFFPVRERRVVSFNTQNATNRMLFLFELLFRVLQGNYTLGNFIYISQVLSLILAETYDREKHNTTLEQNKHVTSVVRYMYKHLKENLTLEDVVEEFDLSRSYLKVGQFEILPDFDELAKFKGISDPANYRLIQEKADKLGLLSVWKQYVEATGELSRICYREEIEAAMRTKKFSGISLLGLQDFPGQGTALVGMINSHMERKPFAFARPEEFRKFFRDQLPLVQLPKYTYEDGEILEAEIRVANFGKKALNGAVIYRLSGEGYRENGKLGETSCPMGKISVAGSMKLPLHVEKAMQLELTVEIDGAKNTYPIWVYPKVEPICPQSIYETEHFDERAKEVLRAGGKVYLSPKATKEAMPQSIQTQFTSDFWSVGTFSAQAGGMGQLIASEHPVFRDFPTQSHSNWQWWAMASQRAVILPESMQAIITEMDSYAYMRPMAQLIEWTCGEGKLMLSSMGLQDLLQYPEARALLASVYRYMDSEEFVPKQEIAPEVIGKLVK